MCSSHVLLNEYGQSNGQQTNSKRTWSWLGILIKRIFMYIRTYGTAPLTCFLILPTFLLIEYKKNIYSLDLNNVCSLQILI